MKFRPVGAELFHVDGRTFRRTYRHDEVKSRFLKFCKHAKKWTLSVVTMFVYLSIRQRLKWWFNFY